MEAVLVAANAATAQQYLTPVGSKTPAPVSGVCCAGHAYLAHKQVAVPLVLQLLTKFSQEFDTLQVLWAFKMEAALGQLTSWQATEPLAARLLSKIAEAELEYEPYHLYGKGMLQAAMLRAMQLDPPPFDVKGVSTAMLLKLSGRQLKTWLGLDPSEI
ncbi:hypothetical protein Vretifemale_1243 [Volvox reticuliferus]|nr:hypothetical protein Vretifemale_1243 [Volvox reticuliferus]